jgi:Mrp family chromosome partitioning ATPase
MLYSSSADKKIKSILVSSAGPGEGKTTTVANLAITYANLGKKTLLVDTDLRRPVVHKVLDIKKEPIKLTV